MNELELMLQQELGSTDALPVGVAIDNMQGIYNDNAMDMAQDISTEDKPMVANQQFGSENEFLDRISNLSPEQQEQMLDLLSAGQSYDEYDVPTDEFQGLTDENAELMALFDSLPPEAQQFALEIADGIMSGELTEDEVQRALEELSSQDMPQSPESEDMEEVYKVYDEMEDPYKNEEDSLQEDDDE